MVEVKSVSADRNWSGRVFIGVSLDGFIARPGGDIGWLTDPAPGPSHARIDSDRDALDWDTFFPSVDHLVMGRGTYEKVLTFDEWPYDDKRVIVLSTTLGTEDSRITVVRDLAEAVNVLERAGAREVYVDGGRVIRTFLCADLIDEITLSWAPILIGSGLPLFGALDDGVLGADIALSLQASNASHGGMVHATYRVHRLGA